MKKKKMKKMKGSEGGLTAVGENDQWSTSSFDHSPCRCCILSLCGMIYMDAIRWKHVKKWMNVCRWM